MNCYRCQKRIETPNPDYSVAELVDMCRPRCLECNPEHMPRGGGSHVQLYEEAIGYDMPGDSVDETGDDDAPPADERANAYQRIHPDYRDARIGVRTKLADYPEGLEAFIEPYVLEMLKRFAALDIADVDILHGLLNGMGSEEMARAFGYKSRMTVHARLRKALERNPWLREVYTMGKHYGIRELRHSSPSWQGKTEKPFTRGSGLVLADVPGTDPDALADAVDGGRRKRRGCHG